jgi:hypothetical protein
MGEAPSGSGGILERTRRLALGTLSSPNAPRVGRAAGASPTAIAGVTRLGVPLRARGGDWNAASLRMLRSHGHENQFWIARVTSNRCHFRVPFSCRHERCQSRVPLGPQGVRRPNGNQQGEGAPMRPSVPSLAQW